jgi:uncharacterized protein YqgV (UPF0045/DUF77 family)
MLSISAEVSLYALRQPRLSPAIDEALRVFRAHGLDVRPGIMSTLIAGDEETVFASLKEAFRRAAAGGALVMHVSLSNACPVGEGPRLQSQ